MKGKRSSLIAAILTSLLVAGLAVGIVAAQSGGTTQDEPAGLGWPPTEGSDLVDSYIQKLAANLGITEEALREGLTKTNTQLIDEAVAGGKLTQEQADALKERLADGVFLPPFGMHGGPMHGIRSVMSTALSFLDMDGQQFFDAARDGKSIADLVEEQGKSLDDLKAAIIADATKQLDSEVADEHLTQAQADEMLADLKSNLDDLLTRKLGEDVRPFRGHGRGHFGRFFEGEPGDGPGFGDGTIY